MTEKQITAANVDEKIKQLYQMAFPEEEQIPWDDLMRLIEEMPLDFTAYYDGEEFIGFTIVYPRKTFNWFWYFAVREELRGKGYGQQILTHLIERYKDRANILDMESPEQPCDNLEQRRKRHAFYLRNGFRDTYVYRTYDGITYTIMMMGEGTFTQQDYDDIIQELQQFWWPDDDIEDKEKG
ncbi:MAG: GNAT family N-acetyltransferase [Prevotella sp.]|nr:GNAT family N-acetyltransferase [Prevotella sp.]